MRMSVKDFPQVPGVPKWLNSIIRKAGQTEPEDRYESALAFAEALRAGVDSPQGSVRPPVAVIIGFSVSALVLLLLVWLLGR